MARSFTSADRKPFTVHRCEPRDRYYGETFGRSELGDELVDAMPQMYKENVHTRTADFWKHVFRRLWRDLSHVPVKCCKYAKNGAVSPRQSAVSPARFASDWR